MKKAVRIFGLLVFLPSILLSEPALFPPAVFGEEPETQEAPESEEAGFPDMEADFYITAFDA
ncbi:MAG TPA: hypothetical protein VIU33_01065, partial [Nitrospiria bacterium]